MPVIDTGQVRLFFTDSGPGSDSDSAARSATPLLLVHGWTCDSHDWVFQLDAFAAHHRVIAPDLRGHGRSSQAPDGDYSAQRYAADLAELLTRLQIGPVVVVGHSLGASVAAALCVEHPDLVRAMVAIEPAYGQDEQTVAWMRDATTSFGDETGNEVAAELQAATEPLAPRWLRTWHRRRALGMDPLVLEQSFHGMYFAESQISGQPRSDRYLAHRTCPTLAFHRLPHMAAWESGIVTHPYSRVVSWEGSGHWVHQERVGELNAIVLEWVAGLPDGQPVAVHPAMDAATRS